MQRKLISNLQILRFAAAASVLMDHAADIFLPDRGFLERVPLSAGVDVFFVISGFVMTWLTSEKMRSELTARTFLIRRSIRIVPAYWFFTTLLVIVVLSEPQLVRSTRVNAEILVTSYAFIPWPRLDGIISPILSQGWTLNYEAFFYIFFAAALLVRRGLVFLVFAFCGLAAAYPFIPFRMFIASFYTDPIILEFAAGILLGQIYLAGMRLSAWGTALCAASALTALILLEPFHSGYFGRPVCWGIPATLLVAAFVLRPDPTHSGALRRFLQEGGDASYTLYLSHTFSINAVALLLQRAWWGLPEVGFVVAIMVSIAAAMLFYRLVERPFTAWLQRSVLDEPMPPAQTVAP